MKRTIFLLLIAGLLLTGCNTIPQQDPIDTNAPASTVCTTTEPTHTGPLFVKDYLDPKHSDWSEIKDYEVMIPEDGVLILTDQEAIRQVYIEGDVYITATADVSFEDVVVTGKVYCHGRLTGSNYSHYSVYAYCAKSMKTQICSHFDGIHGLYTMEPGLKGSCSPIVSNNALDYAFKTWGNFGPATEIPEITVFKEQIKPQVIQHGDSSKLYPDVYIFTGNGLVRSQKFRGDVYITADAVAEFKDVAVFGNIYCYGQLKLSETEPAYHDQNDGNSADAIYCYSFNETCDSFDGVHGLVVGGPISCNKIVISDNALDYAFQAFGKQ